MRSEPGLESGPVSPQRDETRQIARRLARQAAVAVEILTDSWSRSLARDDLESMTSGNRSDWTLPESGHLVQQVATRMVLRITTILFAESRGLLPLDNETYHRSYSMQYLARNLAPRVVPGILTRREVHTLWPRILALFRLVHGGSGHLSNFCGDRSG